ncbi:hypothetical protein FHS72_000858 [Loktanella ponticola]|uniref:Glycosyltransferase RgtA/B/C/D-like domain-containing protein n=1 Tax=Yoonia ponticola TaxID=1524255 RepID=A0A7W9BIT3_9RHOB|nr:hypothetical protein [Yoonia ponticola]MBB5721251.1 hypothetical protein [Yoonia ponticola]
MPHTTQVPPDGSEGVESPALPSRYATPVVLAIGLVLFAINLWRNRFFLHDDAFISLRYAQNFADAGDLSWNLGDRVEGYTNFLYVMITSALLKAGIDPVVAVRLINIFAVILLVWAVFLGARAMYPHRSEAAALGVAMILGNVSLSVWVLGGLEAPLAAAFVAGAMAFVVRALVTQAPNPLPYWTLFCAGIAFAFAVLTRPDGVIIVAATFFALLIAGPFGWKHRLTCAVIVAGIPFVVFMIHLGWRVSYYGDILPNTFHAKVGLDLALRLERVGDYLLRSALLYLPVMTCSAIALVATLVWGRLNRVAIVLLIVCGAFVGYVIWSGGDHMAAARVLLPISGPFALLVVALWGSLRPIPARIGLVALLFIMIVAALTARSYRMDWAAFNGTIVGRYIAANWPAGSTVGLNTAGSTPFHAPSHIYIDMLGLNDRTIAMRADVPILARRQSMPGHGKGDGAYVLSLAPDYLILGGSEGINVADADKWFLTGLELRDLEGFSACYAVATATLPIPADLAKFRPTAGHVTFTYYQRTCE